VIYKQNATWVADYVAGADVLGFRQLFGQSGLLTQDCLGILPAGHAVLTGTTSSCTTATAHDRCSTGARGGGSSTGWT